MFQCQDGSCLTQEKVCDGIPDCGQEEDELQCEKKVELTIQQYFSYKLSSQSYDVMQYDTLGYDDYEEESQDEEMYDPWNTVEQKYHRQYFNSNFIQF